MTDRREPVIRPAKTSDVESIRALHVSAFGGTSESNLVAAMHAHCHSLVSLVALLDSVLVGHILFSPVRVEPATDRSLWGLAPMAVQPAVQKRGIGGQLIHAGIRACREKSVDAIVVLGHKGYYPRFGFRPASEFGLQCTYDVPANAFMALELQVDGLHDVAGIVHYHPLFDDL